MLTLVIHKSFLKLLSIFLCTVLFTPRWHFLLGIHHFKSYWRGGKALRANEFTQFIEKTYLYHQLLSSNCLQSIPLLWSNLYSKKRTLNKSGWCNTANKLQKPSPFWSLALRSFKGQLCEDGLHLRRPKDGQRSPKLNSAWKIHTDLLPIPERRIH